MGNRMSHTKKELIEIIEDLEHDNTMLKLYVDVLELQHSELVDKYLELVREVEELREYKKIDEEWHNYHGV